MATLPAFATLDDLAERVTVDDETWAQAALDDASALIRAEVAPVTWVDDDTGGLTDDMPDIVRIVCLDLAQDRYGNPGGMRAETIGDYSYTRSDDTGGGRRLSTLQRSQVRKAAGLARASTITLESPYPTRPETVYLPVDPPGEPIPWSGPDGY